MESFKNKDIKLMQNS